MGKENHSTRRKMILTIFYHHVKGDFKDGKMAALCWAKFNTDCGQSIIIMPRYCPKCVKLAWQRWPCDEPSDYPALSHRASQFIVFVCHGFNEYCSLLNIETLCSIFKFDMKDWILENKLFFTPKVSWKSLKCLVNEWQIFTRWLQRHNWVPSTNQQTSRETFVLKTPFRAGPGWSIQIKQIKLSQMAKEVVGPPT